MLSRSFINSTVYFKACKLSEREKGRCELGALGEEEIDGGGWGRWLEEDAKGGRVIDINTSCSLLLFISNGSADASFQIVLLT